MSRIVANARFFIPLLALVVLGLSRCCEAVVFRPFVGFGGYGMGYGGYGYGYGGGTVAGNYMNGMSNVIRAEGQYNLLTAQAAVNNEEARSRYLDNKKKWHEIYLQSREARDKRVAEQFARSKHSPEVLAAAAASDLPHKLSSEVLDPVTGQITWPEVLLGAEFADQRKEVEQFLELRAKTSHTDETGEKIRAAAAKMSEMLRKNVQNIPANEYMAGRKFLDSLVYAVR
jgi:hypothetical protein